MDEQAGQSGSAPKQPLSAAQTRAVFAENLRTLLAGHASVAQVCREIGINRTQFNRYLSSEAFPRPDVLSLICRYFDVDARILLEPLSEIYPDMTDPNLKEADKRIADLLDQTSMGNVNQERLPEGIYNLYRRTSFDSAFVSSWVCKISHHPSGRTTIHGVLPRDMSKLLGTPDTIHARRLFGPVLQHPLGISFTVMMECTQIAQYNFVEFSYLGNDRIHFGFSMTTHRFGALQTAVMPVLLIRLDGGWSDLVASVRAAGIRNMSELPSHVSSYLSRSKPLTASNI